jgi:hypothetical protein
MALMRHDLNLIYYDKCNGFSRPTRAMFLLRQYSLCSVEKQGVSNYLTKSPTFLTMYKLPFKTIIYCALLLHDADELLSAVG